MATNILAGNDVIKIERAFVSGKERITINDELAFEGKIKPDQPIQMQVGSRTYIVETKIVSKFGKVTTINLQILEGGETIHAEKYDQLGKPVSVAQARSAGAIQVCSLIGAAVGFATMMALSAATRAVPGGAIGGAIGGGGGSAIGYGIGWLLFRRSK